MNQENAFQNSPESSSRFERQMLPLSETNSILMELHSQLDDEWEYGTLVQVFGGINRNADGNLFIIRDNAKIAGVGALTLDNKHEATLQALYVPKNYRGQGVGDALATARIDYLLGQGVTKIHINVTSSGSRHMADKLRMQYGDLIAIEDHGDHFV